MRTTPTIEPLYKVAQKYIPSKNVYPMGYKEFDVAMDGGLREGELITISASSGEGKCLGKGTKVLMYDGSIKKVEDIMVGDLIMGDDSTSREVLSLASGREEMYDVIPVKGEKYIVNKSHILSLKQKNEIIDISIKEFLEKKEWFKNTYKGYRVGVNWNEKEVSIDPYFIGLWLGDGITENVGITTMDNKIIEYLEKLAEKMNLKITIQSQKNNKAKTYSLVRKKDFKSVNKCKNGKYIYENKKTKIGGYGNIKSLKVYLRELDLINNKHIPDVYKVNSRKNRLSLFAGLIDSDGYINHEGFVFVNKNKRLIEDVTFLARSLGFAAYTKSFINKKYNLKYWKIGISGDLSVVPVLLKRKKCKKRKQIKDVLVTGIKLKSIGIDNYYGFEIDGNRRFLLGDFTVTHNTTFCQNLTINFHKQSIPTLWFTYEQDPYYLGENFKKLGANLTELLAYSPIELASSQLKFIDEEIKEGVEDSAIKVVVIDHLHYLIPLKSSINASLMIGGIVRELKTIAVKNKVIVFLIAHTRKINAGEDLNLASIRDSSLVVCESDYVFLLERRRKKKNAREKLNSDYISSGDELLAQSRVSLAKNRRTGKILYLDFNVKDGKFLPITKDYEEPNNHSSNFKNPYF